MSSLEEDIETLHLDKMITFDYAKLQDELQEIMNQTHIELKCPKCGSTKITYRVKRTRQMARAGMTHVGAYCEHSHFIKWVKQNEEILSKAIKPKSLF